MRVHEKAIHRGQGWRLPKDGLGQFAGLRAWRKRGYGAFDEEC